MTRLPAPASADVFADFRTVVTDALATLAARGDLPTGLAFDRVDVEPPRDPSHGDFATNAAMVLAKAAGQPPRRIAEALAELLRAAPHVTAVDVAGPGFVNISVAAGFWQRHLSDILRLGTAYGDGAPTNAETANTEKVNVEYVSTNPTGPLHVGHARGAVFGDVLASLLEKAGYDVTREYYVNDAGAQVDALARSVHLRYRAALREAIGTIPDGLYPGEYLIPVGQAVADADGGRWRDCAETEWLPHFRDVAVTAMLDLIKADLAALGIIQDVFTSERSLVEAGAVDDAVALLDAKGLLYTGTLEPPKGQTPDDWEPRPQRLFRATEFGDDVDRPQQKSDGSWTYFATDLAYHNDKSKRGFRQQIDVWGADHGGYVKRMRAGVTALSDGTADLDVKLCQMVRLLEAGEPAKMSKRAGNFVTLADLLDKVGPGVIRFIMLTRKNDAPLDFDLVKVREQSRDNPVFYVQYAHARCHSVLRLAAEAFPDADLATDALAAIPLDSLTDSDELALIKVLAVWPRTVAGAAMAHEPHRLAFYLQDVAAAFHGLWTKGKEDAALRFLVPEDKDLTMARLALVRAVASVIASGLLVMGVAPVEEMRS